MTRQTRHTKSQKRQSGSKSQGMALFLIGAGLLVLGFVGLLLLPRPQTAGASSNQGAAGPPSSIPAPVNYPAPALELNDLDGQAVSLADYAGQVVLVNNWATWCPPCKAEMPILKAYFEAHRHQDFTLIGIEAGESPEEVSAFAAQYELTFPVWPDPTQKAVQVFRNGSLPNSYLIDRSGMVRLAWTGAISREMLEKYVTPLLEE